MRRPSEREIRAFVEQLTPEAFTAPSTAVSSGQAEPALSGATDFHDFVDRHLQAAVDGYTAGFAIVHRGGSWRRYHRGVDEEAAAFASRVGEEARAFGAVWVFIASPGRAAVGWSFDAGDPAQVAAARASGRMRQVINWYAAGRGGGVEIERFGVLEWRGGRVQVVESETPQGAAPVFRRILADR